MNKSSTLPNLSAKKSRHDTGINKYKDFEQGKLNKNTLNELMKGERDETTVPKTGEFLVIASDKKTDKNKISDIPIMDLLDTTKTFKELRDKHQDSHSRIQTPLQAFSTRPVSRRIKMENFATPFQQQRLFSGKTMKSQSNANDLEDLLDEKLSIYQDMQQDRHPIEDAEGQYQVKLTKNIKIIMQRQQSGLLSPSAQ